MLLECYDKLWDFELLDTGDGYRLERWGDVILARPDPQIIWPKSLPENEWQKANAIFVPGRGEDRGKWNTKDTIPNPWSINFQDLKFILKLSPFKHTGIFPEQAAQWSWITSKLKDSKIERLKILNLFAYTGGATMVLAKAGCQVTHVDASKPATTWANENYKLNFGHQYPPFDYAQGEHSPAGNVRWILDDAVKFVKRELKRGVKYDGIIMDPPAFGHSPQGKPWKFNDDLPGLLATCVELLSDNARFLVINGYATNSSALALNNLLEDAMKQRGGKIEFGELCLRQQSGRMISTGIFARWQKNRRL